MSSPTVYNLNEGQQGAADAFFEFLFSDNKEFIISGAAGTGKTHLMNYIIDTTMPRYHEACQLLGMDPVYTDVAMTATTNKAAEVLSLSTGRETQTIHSFLALKVYEDYSNGSAKLSRTTNWRVHERKIVFIDECSMIDSDLYNYIREGFNNCKIVYVGDHSQLAPVMEKLSPIYRPDVPFFALTQQMRNASQPNLMNVCQQLRETVETGEFKPIRIVPGVIDLLDDAQMQAELSKHFAKQTQKARVLAYTNRRVIEFNEHIRSDRGLPNNSFMVGELLVNNSLFRRSDRSLHSEDQVYVLKNWGPSSVEITINPDGTSVNLDVELLDIDSPIHGSFYKVPVPTDKRHYSDLIKYFGRIKNFERYFHLKQNYIDLRPRDAATVHKAQGSTYDTVFIDLGNISTCTLKDQAARMLYVAFSRARERVFLYGNLAEKYGGLIR